jgi:hypothetical protein
MNRCATAADSFSTGSACASSRRTMVACRHARHHTGGGGIYYGNKEYLNRWASPPWPVARHLDSVKRRRHENQLPSLRSAGGVSDRGKRAGSKPQTHHRMSCWRPHTELSLMIITDMEVGVRVDVSGTR